MPASARPVSALAATAAAIALAAAAPAAHAIGIDDAAGDWLAGYAGSRAGDLDVVGGFVAYNAATDVFTFSATMNADVGLTPAGFYVWGLDRGAGSPGFAADGLPNIRFDALVILRPDGSGTVNRLGGGGSTTLAAGTAHSFGSTIVANVAGSLLPSTGLAKTGYTWNLWPRDGALPAGFGQISDFAPDTTNALVTAVGVVPEPATAWLFALGAGALALRGRRAPGG